MTNKQEIEYICDKLTYNELAIQCIEECSELIQSLTKYCRITSNNKPNKPWSEIDANMQEEVADVMVAIRVLSASNLICMEEAEEIANKKLKRWSDRLHTDD